MSPATFCTRDARRRAEARPDCEGVLGYHPARHADPRRRRGSDGRRAIGLPTLIPLDHSTRLAGVEGPHRALHRTVCGDAALPAGARPRAIGRFAARVARATVAPLALVATLVELAGYGAALAAGDDDIARLEQLGAGVLVEQLIDSRQQSVVADPARWAALEVLRLGRLRARGAWRAVVERRAAYPEDVPVSLVVVADEVGAEAYRALGDPSSAARLLDGLMASGEGAVETRARWSRLRVRALLDAGETEAARAALALHRDAFPDDGDARAVLDARLLLLDGHLEEVLLVLDGVEGTESALLRLAAVARSGPVDPRGFARAASPVTDSALASAAERYQAWVLVAGVARARREADLAAAALENALAEGVDAQAPGLLARTGADALWEAYEALARRAGNERQLLVGRFDDWLALGVERAGDDVVTARALLAFVALRGDRASVREAAGERYAALAGADAGTRRVAGALWTGARAVEGLDTIPESLRPLLVIELVAAGRYEAAGALVPDGPSEAPAGLRVAYARALVRAGLAGVGVETLLTMLEPGAAIAPALWRASIAASADLLAVGNADEAERLLEALSDTELDSLGAATLAFQRGAVREAQGDDAGAAGAYLEASLGLAGADAVVARMQAARAAARAGLAGDAEGIRAALAAETGTGSLPSLLGEPIR